MLFGFAHFLKKYFIIYNQTFKITIDTEVLLHNGKKWHQVMIWRTLPAILQLMCWSYFHYYRCATMAYNFPVESCHLRHSTLQTACLIIPLYFLIVQCSVLSDYTHMFCNILLHTQPCFFNETSNLCAISICQRK